MSNVPGVIPSAAAGMPYHSAKRTRLEYSTVAKTVIKNVDISDHFPVNSVWSNSKKTLDAEKTKKIDRELITLKSDKIINHNYYAVLSEHIESPSDLIQ
ncbi:hypothetical protein BB561_005612 [Smittium simulii]|uniref:Uncharacterized protein n=1 Tax=Smittium simulii TaxID=133385 RepID=A0A2T9Y9K2_9FUNG|nr:hypothetical protein BB561_005612 [Smittium simulii]